VTAETARQTVLFPDLFDKPVVATFGQAAASSDGGAILLKAADRAYHLLDGFAACLIDRRQAGKVQHALRDLIAQRVYGLACGYADANDVERLGDDPIQKLLLDRDPIAGDALASQPTISRFENAIDGPASYRLGRALACAVIARHAERLRGRARRITIDLDPTDDPTHGAQQLSFFNGHYDRWCYLPMLGFLTFDREPEQHLFAAILRPGNATATRGAAGLLRRTFVLLRAAFPRARLRVRLDGGFASPALLDLLDAEPGVEYVVAMGENAVLTRAAAPLMALVRPLAEQTGQTAHVYGETTYQAGTWSSPRRVIIKAEVVRLAGRDARDNPRFVITNLRQTPRFLYETVYCARGDIENRIKELHHGLEIDRTSCTRFWANQLRVLLTAAAYVLLQEIRRQVRGTGLARAQVSTLRNAVLTLGTHVVRSVRRIVLHLPRVSPHREAWQLIATRLGATAG
jgi:hypothetical protein